MRTSFRIISILAIIALVALVLSIAIPPLTTHDVVATEVSGKIDSSVNNAVTTAKAMTPTTLIRPVITLTPSGQQSAEVPELTQEPLPLQIFDGYLPAQVKASYLKTGSSPLNDVSVDRDFEAAVVVTHKINQISISYKEAGYEELVLQIPGFLSHKVYEVTKNKSDDISVPQLEYFTSPEGCGKGGLTGTFELYWAGQTTLMVLFTQQCNNTPNASLSATWEVQFKAHDLYPQGAVESTSNPPVLWASDLPKSDGPFS